MKKQIKQIRKIQRDLQQERIKQFGPDHTRPLPQDDKRRKKSKYPDKWD